MTTTGDDARPPVQHGWWYSLFAGFWSLVSVLSLRMQLPQTGGLQTPIEIWSSLEFGGIAFLSARIAGWMARGLGKREHGWLAGALTAPVFGVVFMVAGMLHPTGPSGTVHDPFDLAVGFLIWWLIVTLYVITFSLLGTAVFLALLQGATWRRPTWRP